MRAWTARILGSSACVSCVLRRLSRSDPVHGGFLHFKGAYLWSVFNQVADELRNPGIVVTIVGLSMLSRFPEADGENAVRILIGNQGEFILESRLAFQDRDHFIAYGASKVSSFSRFGGYFYNSCKHTGTPFVEG